MLSGARSSEWKLISANISVFLHWSPLTLFPFVAYLQAPTQFQDIWGVISVINATGTPTYGSPVSNIATIVDSVLTGPSGGSVITQFQYVHLVRGLARITGMAIRVHVRTYSYSVRTLSPVDSLQWLGKTPPIYTAINTTIGAQITIDLFDSNFTVSAHARVYSRRRYCCSCVVYACTCT